MSPDITVMTPLSDRMLAANAELWDAMQAHRFVRDIEASRLPDDVFHRYLVYEGAFVSTAIGIVAQGVAKAPGIGQQRRLIAVLDALANEQIGYFERTFEALRIDPAAHDVTVPPVEAFRAGMAAIAADGPYLDVVTILFAAEWMYWHWCSRAAAKPGGNAELRRWVELHAEAAFADQARWLKDEVDGGGETLEEREKIRLTTLFGRVLRLEIDFHTAAYGAAF